MATHKPSSRTAVYIDGYNLYYGRLRGTAHKWLDVVALFDALLRQRDQNESVAKVKFFTAPALARFASHGAASVEAQSAYHRALMSRHPERFEVINGTHAFDRDGALLPVFAAGEPYDRARRVRVWKLEEKKTDVNLALSMYRDASKGLYERIILVSNDSDAEPALAAIGSDFPDILIGVVMPIHPPSTTLQAHRRPSGSLANLADWTLPHLTDAQLHEAQLPPKLPTRKNLSSSRGIGSQATLTPR